MRTKLLAKTEIKKYLGKEIVHKKDGMKIGEKWPAMFDNPALPLILEIGSGSGLFLKNLIDYHRRNVIPSIPEGDEPLSRLKQYNYVGLEIKEERLLKAVKKNRQNLDAGKLKFLWANAEDLKNYFDRGQVDEIYINFCDPWPKKRHIKNRLIHSRFLNIYKAILKSDGRLYFKTDNEALFEFSVKEFKSGGWEILEKSRDLHKSGSLGDTRDDIFGLKNILTEYEEKFLREGRKVYYIKIKNQISKIKNTYQK